MQFNAYNAYHSGVFIKGEIGSVVTRQESYTSNKKIGHLGLPVEHIVIL